MAVAAKDMPITREMVAGWLAEYTPTDGQVEFYIAGKVNELNLPDHMVNTSALENYPDQTSVVELILDDLSSYGEVFRA